MEHQGGTDDEPTKRVEMSTRGTSSGQDTVKGDGKPMDEILSTGLPITHGSEWGVSRQGPQVTPTDPLQQHQSVGHRDDEQRLSLSSQDAQSRNICQSAISEFERAGSHNTTSDLMATSKPSGGEKVMCGDVRLQQASMFGAGMYASTCSYVPASTRMYEEPSPQSSVSSVGRADSRPSSGSWSEVGTGPSVKDDRVQGDSRRDEPESGEQRSVIQPKSFSVQPEGWRAGSQQGSPYTSMEVGDQTALRTATEELRKMQKEIGEMRAWQKAQQPEKQQSTHESRKADDEHTRLAYHTTHHPIYKSVMMWQNMARSVRASVNFHGAIEFARSHQIGNHRAEAPDLRMPRLSVRTPPGLQDRRQEIERVT